jgi:signal transduction histidine kinase
LVIDDEKRLADSVCQLLRREGYEAEAVHSGQEALDRFGEDEFDLVLTDLLMPDVDGMDVLREIRRRRPDTIAIIMTGHASTDSAIEALHHSAFDYIRKPFEIDDLLGSIHRACGHLDAEELREDMVSMISHDIKVPLTSILGYTSLIHRSGKWHPRGAEFVRIIASNANKILALLDNYLTTCKIETGTLQLDRAPTDIAGVLDELRTTLAPELTKRRMTLAIEASGELPILLADENLLYRALANIANNAVKYSPTGSTIDVRVTAHDEEDSPLGTRSLCIDVENAGPGIPAHEIEQVFDRYQRAASSSGIEGSGIGLFVVKTVVEAHGGIVEVESVPNERTRFTAHLPLAGVRNEDR